MIYLTIINLRGIPKINMRWSRCLHLHLQHRKPCRPSPKQVRKTMMHASQVCDNHMKSDTCILYICEDHIWLTNYVRFPKPRARGPSGSCYITVMVGGNWGRRIRPCSQQILPSRLIGVLPCLRLRLGNYTGIFWALGMVQGLFIQFQISIYIYIYDMIWYDMIDII